MYEICALLRTKKAKVPRKKPAFTLKPGAKVYFHGRPAVVVSRRLGTGGEPLRDYWWFDVELPDGGVARHWGNRNVISAREE
jgi:hypothetical protein